MGGRRLVVRIVGVVSTTHGFAYAVTEGPRHLVASGQRAASPSLSDAVRRFGNVISKARPLFVAFDRDSGQRKGRRGRQFVRAVSAVCEAHGVMLIAIGRTEIRRLSKQGRPSKWDIGDIVATWFPEIASKLPPRRKPWESENDRIGIFMAIAAAVAAWEGFRGPKT